MRRQFSTKLLCFSISCEHEALVAFISALSFQRRLYSEHLATFGAIPFPESWLITLFLYLEAFRLFSSFLVFWKCPNLCHGAGHYAYWTECSIGIFILKTFGFQFLKKVLNYFLDNFLLFISLLFFWNKYLKIGPPRCIRYLLLLLSISVDFFSIFFNFF